MSRYFKIDKDLVKIGVLIAIGYGFLHFKGMSRFPIVQTVAFDCNTKGDFSGLEIEVQFESTQAKSKRDNRARLYILTDTDDEYEWSAPAYVSDASFYSFMDERGKGRIQLSLFELDGSEPVQKLFIGSIASNGSEKEDRWSTQLTCSNPYDPDYREPVYRDY